MDQVDRELGQPLDAAVVADKLAIIELVQLERYWRDIGEWDLDAECFTEEAVITTSWFKGNAREFARQSKVMAERGRHSKHPIHPIYVNIVDDRALVESRSQIQNRDVIEAVAIDTTQYVRFFSRVRRTPDGWRLASFDCIFEKGTLVPVDPSARVPVDWSEVISATNRSAYDLWSWSMTRRGYTVPDDLLGDDDQERVRAFYAAERAWLRQPN